MRTLLFLSALSTLCACADVDKPAPLTTSSGIPAANRPALLDSALSASGVAQLASAYATFRFRDGEYSYRREPSGTFVYTRTRADSTGVRYVDSLTNDGLRRSVATDGAQVQLSPKQQDAYAESVNSVIYFAFMPWALTDAAAQVADAGLDTIGGKPLRRLRVTFVETGGGTDFDDEFLYWLDADDYSLAYLAYSYATDGGGVRFRESMNARNVAGITVRDYKNFAAVPELSVPLDSMATAFDRGELKLLSLIELENVEVMRLPQD